jgi:hypothetical protein
MSRAVWIRLVAALLALGAGTAAVVVAIVFLHQTVG